MNYEGLVLEVRDVCKAFEGVQALNNVNFYLKKGTVHAIIGENGAGKSTLMKIITGYSVEDSGEIIYKGKKIEKVITVPKKLVNIVVK